MPRTIRNISEWTGLKLSNALRKSEIRHKWRDVVGSKSVAPSTVSETTVFMMIMMIIRSCY